jgi:hypothetical protein
VDNKWRAIRLSKLLAIRAGSRDNILETTLEHPVASSITADPIVSITACIDYIVELCTTSQPHEQTSRSKNRSDISERFFDSPINNCG